MAPWTLWPERCPTRSCPWCGAVPCALRGCSVQCCACAVSALPSADRVRCAAAAATRHAACVRRAGRRRGPRCRAAADVQGAALSIPASMFSCIRVPSSVHSGLCWHDEFRAASSARSQGCSIIVCVSGSLHGITRGERCPSADEAGMHFWHSSALQAVTAALSRRSCASMWSWTAAGARAGAQAGGLEPVQPAAGGAAGARQGAAGRVGAVPGRHAQAVHRRALCAHAHRSAFPWAFLACVGHACCGRRALRRALKV
jgi:hypothetical protein